MVCANCGNEFADTEKFCPNCGTPAPVSEAAEAAETASNVVEEAKEQLKKLDPKMIGALVGALVVLIILCSLVFGGGSAKSAVKDYYKALEKGDAKTIFSMTLPKKPKEVYKIYDKAFDALYKGLKKEGKVKWEVEIKKIENINKLDKLDDEVGKIDDLEAFQDLMEKTFDEYDLDASKIKACSVAQVKYTLSVGKHKAVKEEDIVFVYKFKGDWYVMGATNPESLLRKLAKAEDADDYEDAIDDAKEILEDLAD